MSNFRSKVHTRKKEISPFAIISMTTTASMIRTRESSLSHGKNSFTFQSWSLQYSTVNAWLIYWAIYKCCGCLNILNSSFLLRLLSKISHWLCVQKLYFYWFFQNDQNDQNNQKDQSGQMNKNEQKEQMTNTDQKDQYDQKKSKRPKRLKWSKWRKKFKMVKMTNMI